tara:strand:- start:940 stop:1386 length:447 start_codon:yes stop_codon:yes gene_type:complete
MATQIVILNGDTVQLDNEYVITWDKKGTAWQDAWCPNTIHAVIWNNLLGQNEIQTKDPSTGNMAGNTNLNATSDAVGSTTIAALLTWGETRKGQIESAKIDHGNYVENAQTSWVDAGNSIDDFIESNSATASFIDWNKTWEDFDEHLS